EKYRSLDALNGAIENLKQFLRQQKAFTKLQMDSATREKDRKKFDEDLAAAQSKVPTAQKQYDEAHRAYEALVLRHSAESLKPALRAGEPCPVCEQVVQGVPKRRKHEPLEEGKRRQKEAESALRAIERRVSDLEAEIGPLDREIARLRKTCTEAADALTEMVHRLRPFTGPRPGPDSESELRALCTQFGEAELKAGNAVRRVDGLKSERETASRELLAKHNDLKMITKDIQRDNDDLSRLQKESERLRDQLGELAS